MPKLGDPKTIAPVGQLIELRQSNNQQMCSAQYEPKSIIARASFNSSDNISNTLYALFNNSVMDLVDLVGLVLSGIRLSDIARFDENHKAWSHGQHGRKPLPA
ncbi:MAG: hypothetical protein JWR14_1831 [Caballeronia sp.]|jgi:hypothetical protein|uniref:hypothetical protein n=1 Tax=Caballeronia sp. TaxID=1931223 RepID=UPI00261EE7FE|nr:hypothetical protein [Caballeronia sp.]MDB5832001.1 hypothetical protein [Caballeronia sp.]